MKKIISLILSLSFVLLTFSACNDSAPKIDSSDEYIEGQDAQENCIAYQMTANVASSPDSYYLSTLNYLYVIDKKTHKCMPLCTRPDCLHENEKPSYNCEASDKGGIVFYMNSLYYQTEEEKTDANGVKYRVWEICRMNPDGTDKTVVFQTSEFLIWRFKMHRGYIYMEISYPNDGGGYSSQNAVIIRVPVDGGEVEQIEELKDNRSLLDLRFYRNNMYLLYEEAVEGVDENDYPDYLWHYDLTTMERENLNEKLDYPICFLFTIYNGKILYTDSKTWTKLCECDLDGSNNRIVTDFEDVFGKGTYEYYTVLSNDGEKLLVSASKPVSTEDESIIGDKIMIVCDKNYENIESYDIPEGSQLNMFFEPESMLFFRAWRRLSEFARRCRF